VIHWSIQSSCAVRCRASFVRYTKATTLANSR